MLKTNSSFYTRILKIITESGIPFMIGGGMAVYKYTGFNHPTKDLDIFCKAGDYPKIVLALQEAKINVKIRDERWLAQATEGGFHIDVLFSSPNYLVPVDDSWFKYAKETEIYGFKVKLIAAEELLWCKVFVQDRDRFDGADINHIILKSKNLDWQRLLNHMETSWEILFSIILNFRFVYPSERNLVPNWLLKELLSRLTYQLKNPNPIDKICRGPLLSRTQYIYDIEKGGFSTIT